MRNYRFTMITTDVIEDDMGKSIFYEFEVNGTRYEYYVHHYLNHNRTICKIISNDKTLARWTSDGRVNVMNCDECIREVMREEFFKELPVKSVT